MNIKCNEDKIMKASSAPLLTIPPGNIKNLKLSKGNELRTEMSIDNSLRITPISAGPAKSEGNGCASPNLKSGDDSIEYYNY
jgi:antitoxin component of MazEF toxin-antitoxin module